jgi:hypothetical protein
VSYLIVDEGNGSALAQFDRVEDAVQAMAAAPIRRLEPLRLVVFDDSGGDVARTESWITMRTVADRSKASNAPPRPPARARRRRRRAT